MGTIEVGRTHDGFAIRVIGRGTVRESLAVQEFGQRALRDGHSQVVVDLQRCDALDSTFLGSLLILHRSGGPDRRFHVACDDGHARQLLAPCRLDRALVRDPQAPELLGEPAVVPAAVLDSREAGRFISDCHRLLAETGAPGAAALAGVADRIDVELR